MKKKVFLAVLLGTACLAAGCGKKETETEKVTEAALTAESETKTESADETEAETAAETAAEEDAQAETEAETVSEETEAETEAEELGERPDYTALDYVTLGEYKGLSVTVESLEVTEDEITDSIEAEIAAQDKYDQKTEGTVAEGDTVNIDYEGKLDGVAFDGGTAEGADLTIGSDTFIDGFEDGLIGVAVGETVDLNLTFPENYQSTELAGKETVFTVTVNYIREAPELTDELVSELSDGAYSTVDGYREYRKELLMEEKEEEQEYNIYVDLMTQLYNTCTINDYPQELVDYSVASMNQAYESYASMYGMTLEDMITAMGYTEDTFNSAVLENVQSNLQQELILKAIAEQEEMLLSEEEYTAGSADYAAEYGYESTQEFEEAYDKATIEMSLLIDKMLLYVKDNALIEEVQETEALTEAVSEAESEAQETETVSEADTEVSETGEETEA